VIVIAGRPQQAVHGGSDEHQPTCWAFYSRWWPPLSRIFKMWKFEGWEGSKGSQCITMPNFVAIGQIVAEIWRFFNFVHLARKMVAK